jgi:hypothetical protein
VELEAKGDLQGECDPRRLHQTLSNLVFNALNTVSGPLPFHPFELRLPIIKAMSQGLHGALGHRVLKPVLVTFDDHQLIAFDIERLDDGREVLFLPGAPDAWSGSVVLVESERIAPLEVDLATLAKAQQRLGQGTAALLGAERAGVGGFGAGASAPVAAT